MTLFPPEMSCRVEFERENPSCETNIRYPPWWETLPSISHA